MSDNSAFREIAEQSAEEASVEFQETSEQVEPEATQEVEVFAEKGELSGRTPEELEETYQSWQRAYTAKRQKETQELKSAQARVAELEEKLKSTSVQPTVEQKAEAAQEQVELGNMSVQEYTQYMQSLMEEKAREIARSEYENLSKQQKEDQLAGKVFEDFNSSDDRFNENSPRFDEAFKSDVQREMAELLDEHLEKTGSYEGFDAVNLAKQIVERKDRQLDEIVKQRTQQSTQAARMREAKSRKNEIRGSSSTSQPTNGSSIRSILTETLDGA